MADSVKKCDHQWSELLDPNYVLNKYFFQQLPKKAHLTRTVSGFASTTTDSLPRDKTNANQSWQLACDLNNFVLKSQTSQASGDDSKSVEYNKKTLNVRNTKADTKSKVLKSQQVTKKAKKLTTRKPAKNLPKPKTLTSKETTAQKPPMDFDNIIFVDAKQGNVPIEKKNKQKQKERNIGLTPLIRHIKGNMPCRVPLCSPPNEIFSRAKATRQDVLSQQEDPFESWAELSPTTSLEQMQLPDAGAPDDDTGLEWTRVPPIKLYHVPEKKPCLKKGMRFCGNFYYA